ncbi:MAG TPA: 4'-phosphopantetheinyl transferase superfamily protein [Desulfosalsimonadaceae bacterium]|nr:4'-phosphopantetheinyl transferase superfamily protein [Desulfosalsimonadaceae bacterium]
MKTPRLYPVVRAVPPAGRNLSGKAQVDFLRRYARQAVAHSARPLDLSIDVFNTDEKGAPLPADGVYWSLSHKPDYVAGIAARHPTGIDIEKIRPVGRRLFAKVIDESERKLLDADPNFLFFRFWTAKEVVLKRMGIGLAGLSKCRVRRVIDDDQLVVDYQATGFTVIQTFFNDHIAAVLKTAQDTIEWQLG